MAITGIEGCGQLTGVMAVFLGGVEWRNGMVGVGYSDEDGLLLQRVFLSLL